MAEAETQRFWTASLLPATVYIIRDARRSHLLIKINGKIASKGNPGTSSKNSVIDGYNLPLRFANFSRF